MRKKKTLPTNKARKHFEDTTNTDNLSKKISVLENSTDVIISCIQELKNNQDERFDRLENKLTRNNDLLIKNNDLYSQYLKQKEEEKIARRERGY